MYIYPKLTTCVCLPYAFVLFDHDVDTVVVKH